MVVKKTIGISKKILCIVLAIMVMTALALPTFAAENAMPREAGSPVGQGSIVLNGYGLPNANGCLNISGSGGAYQGQTVNLFEHTGSADQIWVIESSGINGGAYIYQSQRSSTGVRLAVNFWRTAIGTGVYPVKLAPTVNNTEDTNLSIYTISTNHVFRAWLKDGPGSDCDLWIDLSNTASSRSDVYFYNAGLYSPGPHENYKWYWYSTY